MRRRQRRFVAVAVAAMLCASLTPARAASAAPPAECSTAGPDGPMWVTADCIDPLYDQTIVDPRGRAGVDSGAPRKVSGTFTGTDYRFNIYFRREQWDGRFYQHVYPFIERERIDSDLGFAMASGGYLVQTNSAPCSCAGYRVDAQRPSSPGRWRLITTGPRTGSTAISGAAVGGRSRRSGRSRTRPACGTERSPTSSPTRPRSRTTTPSPPWPRWPWKTSSADRRRRRPGRQRRPLCRPRRRASGGARRGDEVGHPAAGLGAPPVPGHRPVHPVAGVGQRPGQRPHLRRRLLEPAGLRGRRSAGLPPGGHRRPLRDHHPGQQGRRGCADEPGARHRAGQRGVALEYWAYDADGVTRFAR